MSFVLDSSVALSWCFKDEETPATLLALRMAKTRAMFVPSLWHVEMSNILGVAFRKGRLSEAELVLAVDTFSTLELHTDKPLRPTGFSALLPLMRTYDLTAYDATYLDLAMRLNLPLATFDNKLIAAAKQAGLTLVGESL